MFVGKHNFYQDRQKIVGRATYSQWKFLFGDIFLFWKERLQKKFPKILHDFHKILRKVSFIQTEYFRQ